jgi:hypothetical protein
MSTIDLRNSIVLLDRWSETGCHEARAIKRPTPHSPPRSSLSRTHIGAAINPNALTNRRNRQHLDPDPITAPRADAAKSP